MTGVPFNSFGAQKCGCNSELKDPSQPPPFSMPSKLLILHGEAKSYCLTVSCVLKVCLIIFSSFTVISFISTCSE